MVTRGALSFERLHSPLPNLVEVLDSGTRSTENCYIVMPQPIPRRRSYKKLAGWSTSRVTARTVALWFCLVLSIHLVAIVIRQVYQTFAGTSSTGLLQIAFAAARDASACRLKYGKSQLGALLRDCNRNRRGLFIQALTIPFDTALFQRPQHMAIAFAKAGYLVLYLTGTKDTQNREQFLQVRSGLFLSSVDSHQSLGILPNIHGAVVSFYSTISAINFAQVELSQLRGRGNILLYEYIDDISPQISTETSQLLENYKHVSLDTFDLFAASSRNLHAMMMRDKSMKSEQIVYAPNAVNYEDYGHGISSPSPRGKLRARFNSIKRPIVGYFGALAPWLWYELINNLTATMTDFDFVMIGPDYLGGSKLLIERENLHITGAVDYKYLRYFARRFDVALIPFAPGPIAETTSPLKLFEYFALGKPVVAPSFMLECTAFDVVLHAASSEEFALQIRRAFELRQDVDYLSRLDVHARQNTWDQRAQTIMSAYERVKPRDNLR